MWQVCLFTFFLKTYNQTHNCDIFDITFDRNDVDLYCIFDGHDGHLVAEACSQLFVHYLCEQMKDVALIDDLILHECLFFLFIFFFCLL
jgi:hypothetical protein